MMLNDKRFHMTVLALLISIGFPEQANTQSSQPQVQDNDFRADFLMFDELDMNKRVRFHALECQGILGFGRFRRGPLAHGSGRGNPVERQERALTSLIKYHRSSRRYHLDCTVGDLETVVRLAGGHAHGEFTTEELGTANTDRCDWS